MTQKELRDLLERWYLLGQHLPVPESLMTETAQALRRVKHLTVIDGGKGDAA